MSNAFQHLGTGGRAAARLAGSSRTVIFVAVAATIVVSWAALLLMAASTSAVLPPAASGPGGSLFGSFGLPEIGGFATTFVHLCLSPAGSDSAIIRFAALVPMWLLMSVAMMLPSASPMIRTYCEIADTAARAGKRTVHPLVLVAGYLAVWLNASLVFAAATVALQSLMPDGRPLAGYAAASALAVAGLWQFSSLKEACLTKCRAPFATLFSRWTDRPAGIFRLGVDQGLWCLGCCWALMLVMFVVGVMNLFWMALIGLFAIVEKGEKGRALSLLAGTILLVWAAAMLVVWR